MIPSSGDVLLLEQAAQHDVPFYVFGTPKIIVATAQVNQNVFSYPLVEIAVDNTSAGWLTEGLRNRQFMIGTAPGTGDVCYGVLRRDVTSNTLFIDPKQVGESGYAVDIHAEILDNYFISILKNRPPWGHGSSIRKRVFYKYWDRAYTDEGRNPDPIVQMGGHHTTVADSYETTLSAAGTHVFPGRTISSYAWTLDGGSGSPLNTESVEATFAPGFYEVRCTVTDNKGKARTGYRYVWVGSTDSASAHAPLNVRYDLLLAEGVQDEQGLTLTLTFSGEDLSEAFFPGQMIVLQENPAYDGQALETAGVAIDQFVGYVTSLSHRVARGVRETTLTVESPMKIADKIAIENQYMQEQKNPQDWSQVTSILSNPLGVLYYLSAHHAPYLIDGHDLTFFSGIQGLRRKIHNPQGKSLGSQLRNLMQFFVGNIGSRADGTTVMRQNPQYATAAARADMDTKWHWNADRVVGELSIIRRYFPQVGKVTGYAFSYNGEKDSVPYASLAPGYVRSQAEAEETMTAFTVLPGEGQNACNRITGMHLARLNARTERYALRVYRNIDLAEPCDMEWHALDMEVYYDPLGEGWLNKRALPTRVTRRWNPPGEVRKEITIEFEPETFGYPGVTLPINTGGGGNWWNTPWPSWWQGGDFSPYQDKVPFMQFPFDMTLMLAWNDLFVLGRSETFGRQQVRWEFLRLPVLDACIDPWCDYFTVGPTEPLQAAVLTYDPSAGAMTLWRIEDVKAETPVFTSLKAWGVDVNESFRGHARVLIDRFTTDYWVVAWKNQSGVALDRSANAGATWGSSPIAIGSTMDEPESLWDVPLGIDVFNDDIVVVAKDGTTDIHGDFIFFIYKSLSPAGAFSKVDNPTGWSVWPGSVGMVVSSAIVPMRSPDAPTPTTPLSEVTFDGGTYPHYTISTGTGQSSGQGTFLGFGGQGEMAFGSVTQGFGEVVDVTVTVDLTAFYRIQSVSYFTHFSAGWTLDNRRTEHFVVALDADDNVIGSHIVDNEPGDGFLTGNFTVTAADLGLGPDDQVYKIRVQIVIYWTDGSGTGTTFVMLDDIDIQAELIDYDSQLALYTLQVSTDTYAQRQSFQKATFSTYGIACDTSGSFLDRDRVSAVVADEAGENVELLRSSNGGQTWSRVRRIPGLTGLKRGENAAILFGHNLLAITPDVDGSAVYYQQTGDWAERLVALGEVRGVAGVVG